MTYLGQDLVVWRDGGAQPRVLADRCPHRSARLSEGRILDGQLQCAFHGLRFDGTGSCVLIPWEAEDNKLLGQVSVGAYPTAELGGYVWCYLGNPARYPPPPLEQEVPEELLDPEHFICFRLPMETWDANWLLTVDGGDAYHAVTLHAGGAQDVANEAWRGGKAKHAGVPLEQRRVKIVQTPQGIRGVSIDQAGNQIHHGHFTADIKGDRFVLPCITTNPIRPAPGAAPYAARLWQFPLDGERTWIQRFLSWRAETPAEREEAVRVYNDIALPRLQKISVEDAMIANAQGDLVSARTNEFLFEPDTDMVRLRRQLKDAFLSQRGGRRTDVHDGALVFPM